MPLPHMPCPSHFSHRDADLALLSLLPHLAVLKLGFAVRPPHLKQLATLVSLRSLDLSHESGGVPDRCVLALVVVCGRYVDVCVS